MPGVRVKPSTKSALLRSLCGVLLCLAAPAWAQVGEVTGVVSEAKDARLLAGVKVHATSPALPSPRTVTTDERGQYRLASLPVGLYTLRFERESFQPVTREGVRVEAGRTLGVAVALQALPVSHHPFASLTPFAPPLRLESDGVAWMAVPREGDIRDRAPPWALPQVSLLAAEGSGERRYVPGSKFLRDSDLRGHGVNPTIDTEEENASTYPLRVSTASYALTRGHLERDSLPAEEAVRVEDFVNSFSPKEGGENAGPFIVDVEGFPSPSRKGYHVVRVTLRTRAAFSDVGVQLEFDKRAVARYRLVGYENPSATPPEPLGDDVTPDPVPLAAGATVTAIYEVKLIAPAIAFGVLRILYEEGEDTMWRRAHKLLPSSALRSSMARASPDTRLTYVAAAFAEKLRGSPWTRSLDWARLHALWQDLGEPLVSRPDVANLGALIKQAGTLDARKERPGADGASLDPDLLPSSGR
ncbi:von Willebrand factor type A domain-containing protein [Myxococcus sp. AS-1-15]|uniref:YfbK domain-containing protein n=1 Tax=Myxococcus sp. AS-1-15 TaxID=2874600 RepID=UPI001CBCF934